VSPLSWSIKRAMVVSALRQALHDTGEIAFLESRKVVPVDTGALRGSGSIQTIGEGIIINYSKEYASHIERGWEGGRVWTSSFTRASGATVRGHYKNQSPREGRHFIENSLRKYFIESIGDRTHFQESIIIELKKGFVGNKVTEI